MESIRNNIPSHVSRIPKAGSSYLTAISAISSQPDPFTLSAAVRSSNYATTPVECCSHAWTSFLTLYDFSALRTRACVLRLRPSVHARVCASVCVRARMCACPYACPHCVTVCVLCVCPHTFVFVEYLQNVLVNSNVVALCL